jgi:hypothetical protein
VLKGASALALAVAIACQVLTEVGLGVNVLWFPVETIDCARS